MVGFANVRKPGQARGGAGCFRPGWQGPAGTGHGGWFNLAEMKKRMGNLMRYVNLEVVDVEVVPYLDNSPEDMLKWEKLISDER